MRVPLDTTSSKNQQPLSIILNQCLCISELIISCTQWEKISNMPMQECGIRIWTNWSILSIVNHNLELNLNTLHQVHMLRQFKLKIRNILRRKMISSHTLTIKTHSGQAISHPEYQLKDLLEILEDGFKQSENKYLKLKWEEILMWSKITVKF